MTIYEDMIPELSEFVSEFDAKNFAENILNKPTVVYRTLADLESWERSALFKWLKWFGMSRLARGLNDFVKLSPKQISLKLKMEHSYLMSLVAERNYIISEVREWGNDAFKPHTPPLINSITAVPNYIDGYDIEINGQYFESIIGSTYVNFVRPGVADINRSQVQIINDGGSVSDTQIVIKAVSLPAVVGDNDEVIVYANEMNSLTYILTIWK